MLNDIRFMQEVEVCIATVGVLGDICRAMDNQIASYSDRIMQVLLGTLSDATVDRTIKPQILSSFGDIALAVGNHFETYLPHVLPMLRGAQHLSVQQQQAGNEALYDYNNQLRLGILEAYAGIVHALPNEKATQYLMPEAPVRCLICQLLPCLIHDGIKRLASCASKLLSVSDRQKFALPPNLLDAINSAAHL